MDIKPVSNYISYVSEIAFVNANPMIISKELYYVEFLDNKRTGYYTDNNDFLKKLYKEVRFGNRFAKPSKIFEDDQTKFLKKTDNYIRNIRPQTNHYAYIKIIEDKQNPQLENQIMIMRFGFKIKEKIKEYFFIGDKKNLIYDNSFQLIVEQSSGFPNYDKSHFTDKEIKIYDKQLDLNKEINFKPLNLLLIKRKDKLEKIQNEN
jgi:hypothetical protein